MPPRKQCAGPTRTHTFSTTHVTRAPIIGSTSAQELEVAEYRMTTDPTAAP